MYSNPHTNVLTKPSISAILFNETLETIIAFLASKVTPVMCDIMDRLKCPECQTAGKCTEHF